MILAYLTKFIEENQKNWDHWIPMYLLTYRSLRHETTGAIPAELYYAHDLRLLLDLLRGYPPRSNDCKTEGNYIGKLKKKLNKIHKIARRWLEIKFQGTKVWYDQRARQVNFEVGQKIWLYNPR